jgi:hypothetical protein
MAAQLRNHKDSAPLPGGNITSYLIENFVPGGKPVPAQQDRQHIPTAFLFLHHIIYFVQKTAIITNKIEKITAHREKAPIWAEFGKIIPAWQ